MNKKSPKIIRPTKELTQQFDMLFPILESVYNETKELSKKKQDGALNETKVKIANRVLSKVKIILKDDPTLEFLDLLDEVTLPTNSDAVMIIAQFKAAMQQFKNKHYDTTELDEFWNTSD
jgi:hypothetical protein